MMLWRVSEDLANPSSDLAELTTSFEPLFDFSNVDLLPNNDHGERVRSLAFHRDSLVSFPDILE